MDVPATASTITSPSCRESSKNAIKRCFVCATRALGTKSPAQGIQRLDCYLGLEPPSATEIGLTGVYLNLEIDLYDVRLLTEIGEITNILRGHIGSALTSCGSSCSRLRRPTAKRLSSLSGMDGHGAPGERPSVGLRAHRITAWSSLRRRQ